MNMERERGRPFFACIFTRRKQREIISILPAGVFEETEKCCSPLSLTREGRLPASFQQKFFSLSRLFAIHPSIHPSPLIQRRSPRDKVTRSPILPIFCTLSPVKFPLLDPAFFPSPLPPFKRRPSVRSSCASTQFSNCPPRFHTFFSPSLHASKIGRALNWQN